MKVLFVRSGNDGIDPISTNQGNYLQKKGIHVDYFDVVGKGILGYLGNYNSLRKKINTSNPDIIHAHFSLCGYLSALFWYRKPIVCSLMGSDVHSASKPMKLLTQFFSLFWKQIIVKSEDMYQKLGFKNAIVIPNGVDFSVFYETEKKSSQQILQWNPNVPHILFGSSPTRTIKNFPLAQSVFNLVKEQFPNAELHVIENVANSEVIHHLNACDVLLLTSFKEGSPNIIKEALACNCPIVSTDVGDVKQNVQSVSHSFVHSENDVQGMANRILEIIQSGKRTNGREKIVHLNNENIIGKLIHVYETTVNK